MHGCSFLPCLQHHLSRPTTEQQEGIITACAAMTFKVWDPWTLWSNLLCVHIKWDQPPLLSLKVPTFIPGSVLAKCFVQPQFWSPMFNSVPCPLRFLATYCVPVLCTFSFLPCTLVCKSCSVHSTCLIKYSVPLKQHNKLRNGWRILRYSEILVWAFTKPQNSISLIWEPFQVFPAVQTQNTTTVFQTYCCYSL